MNELEDIKKRKIKEIMESSQYPDNPIEIKEENFDSIISKYPLLAIDCWAAWCAPCITIAPIIEELAKKYKGKIVFGKLDIDTNREIAMKFNVRAIPTLLIFNKGKLIDSIIGALPKETLEVKLKQYLNSERS